MCFVTPVCCATRSSTLLYSLRKMETFSAEVFDVLLANVFRIRGNAVYNAVVALAL